jgi:mono/diheme cytochrome c family protein
MFKPLVAAAVLGLAALPVLAQPPSAAAGKTLYAANCASCHGSDGHGGMHIGSSVAADLRAPHLENLYHRKDALIVRAILEGKDQSGGQLDAPMPRWAGKLSQTDAQNLTAYLHTLHKAP